MYELPTLFTRYRPSNPPECEWAISSCIEIYRTQPRGFSGHGGVSVSSRSFTITTRPAWLRGPMNTNREGQLEIQLTSDYYGLILAANLFISNRKQIARQPTLRTVVDH